MSDPLFGTKVAAAGLSAALLFFGIPQLADRLLGGEAHHGGEHAKLALAYPIEFKTEGGAEVAAAIADLGTLLAAATPAAGERRSAICKSCHTFEKGGADGTGPNLWGVVGRPVAGHSGFKYSAALAGFGGAWTYERLDAFLANSQGFVPGTAMVQRFPKADQRAELLAYLASLSDNPAPFPAPAPPPADEAADSASAPGEEAPPANRADPAPAEPEKDPA